jgi:hypothetical protein
MHFDTCMSGRQVLGGLCCAISLTASCTCGDTGEELTPIWADDGSVGILIREWEEAPSILWPARAYVGHRLERADSPDGDRSRVLERDGDAFPLGFYFMRSQGYFLLSRLGPDGVPLFEEILDAAHVREVPSGAPGRAEECPQLIVIPSPDGRRLARMRSELLGCMTHTSVSTVAASIAILDANTFEQVGRTSTISGRQAPALTWRPDGTLVAVLWDCLPPCTESCVRALQIDPGAPPQPTVAPGCVDPPTTSSPYASNGAHLIADEQGEITIDHADPKNAFGCQLRPSELPRCDAPEDR